MARLEVDIDANVKDLNKKLGQVDSNLNNTKKSFNNFEQFAIGALSGIAAAFSIQAITQFGKAVLDTTAKFQKFEAVLTNTLGSNSQAQIALQQIQDFASRTPFAVDELTEAFVKLANQGFKPTIGELRSLGDLASSTGKSFNQLAEAIIDAQVGEFERLKEFGIRAKKEGENVTFTFKGVETQVKSTDKAIRDYILSLGNAEGVTGAMAGISETLGGKLSNLGDNIEALRLAIGDQTSGVFATSIDWLNEFISLATLAAKGVAQIRSEASLSAVGKVIEANRKQVEELAESYLELNPDFTSQQAFAKAISDVARSYREAAEGGEAFQNQSYTFSELNQINEGFISMAKELLNVSAGSKESAQTFEEFSKAQDKLNEALSQSGNAIELEIFNLENLKRIGEEIISTYDRLGAAIVKGGQLGSFEELDVSLPSTAPQQDVAGVNPLDIWQTRFDELKTQFEAFSGDFIGSVLMFTQNVQAIVQDNLGQAFVGIGEAIGQSLAAGESVISAIGKSLLDSIAAFLGDLGQQLIAFGIAGIAFGALMEAISKGGPLAIPAGIAAIAAGVALVAISSAIRSSAAKGVGGGGSGGGGNVSTGGAGASFSGSGIEPYGYNDINLTSTIRGSDIVLSVERTQNKENNG